LRPLVTSWERDRSLTRFELRRFDRDEVSGQLAALLGEIPQPEVIDVVFGRSGGNAHFVEELADVVRSDGDPADLPPSLRDVLLTRVDALSADAQRMLRAVSVAGLSVPDRLLAEVMGLEKAELFATLREVVENHLVTVEQGGYRYSFRHALTRDAVYEDMLPGERVELHAVYGEALSKDPGLAGPDGEAALPATLAYHWHAALDLPRALSPAIDAAAHATASYAPDEALRHEWAAGSESARLGGTGCARRPGGNRRKRGWRPARGSRSRHTRDGTESTTIPRARTWRRSGSCSRPATRDGPCARKRSHARPGLTWTPGRTPRCAG
jgi:hypothetical protein